MKKVLATILVITSMLCMVACGSSNGSSNSSAAPNFASVDEVIDKIYEEKSVDLPLTTIPVDLSDEFAVSSYTGLSLEDAEKVEAASASESMMGAQAYSLVVVKAKDSADTADLAQKMLSGIDPRKWVCVEADDLKIVTSSPYIMLIMVQSDLSDVVTADDIAAAFTKICGTTDGEYTLK